MAVKNYFITLNNYSEREIEQLKSIPSTYKVWGFEEAPTTGTKHIHAYIQLESKHRKSYIIDYLPRADVRPSLAKKPDQAVHYVKKCGTFEEQGTLKKQGTNTNEIYDTIMACETWQDVLKIKGIDRRLKYAEQVFAQKKPKILEGVKLRKWQQQLLEELRKPADDRKIFYVVDEKGGNGKTFFANYLFRNEGAFYCRPSKGTDIAYMYNNEKIIVYDIPRSSDEQYINWGMIEQLKDGLVMSGKYASRMKWRDEKAHVVIMANVMPPHGVFSEDRLQIIDLAEVGSKVLGDITQNFGTHPCFIEEKGDEGHPFVLYF